MSEIQKLWTILVHINARAASCAEIPVWEMSCSHIVIQLFFIPLLNALRESPLFGNCNSLRASMTALEPDAGIYTLCETPSTWSYPEEYTQKLDIELHNMKSIPFRPRRWWKPIILLVTKFINCRIRSECDVSSQSAIEMANGTFQNCPWGPFKTNRWIHRSGVT